MTDSLDPWNRTGSSEIDPYVYENVAYGQGDKSVGKDGLFNKWYWNNWEAIGKINLDSYLTSYTKINSSGPKFLM